MHGSSFEFVHVLPESAQNAEPPILHSLPRQALGNSSPSESDDCAKTNGRDEEPGVVDVEASDRAEADVPERTDDDVPLRMEDDDNEECDESLRFDDTEDDERELTDEPLVRETDEFVDDDEREETPAHSSKQLKRSCEQPAARRQTLSD
jgi:hypothetical protein